MERDFTFISLFSGIGGLDLGLERSGMRCVAQVEIDDYATRVLEKHWPGVRRWRDVKTFPPEPHNEWRADAIVGGDPCQASSKANAAFGSTSESLGGQFLRVVDVLRPRIVLRENPVARKDAPWPWWKFRSGLESLGYAVLPFRFRACCVGADCQRERVFLLGELVHASRQRLEGGHCENENGRREPRPVSPPIHKGYRIPIPRPRGYGSRSWIPGGVDRIRAIGNAVVPQVAEWIGRRIIEADMEGRQC